MMMPTDNRNFAPQPSIRFIDVYKPSNTADDYKDAYSMERGANIAYRIQQMYPSLPDYIAAGVAANALYESYGNPAVRQGQLPNATGPIKGNATGLFGWDDRAAKLRQLYGDKWNTLDNQMKYFKLENDTTEKRNWSKVLKARDAEEAAKIFATQWERAGNPALEKRTGLARDLYKYIDEYKKKNAAYVQDQAMQDELVAGYPQSGFPTLKQLGAIAPMTLAMPVLTSPFGQGIVEILNRIGNSKPRYE